MTTSRFTHSHRAIGAMGSLSILGGIVLDNMTALTGGGAAFVGGLLVGVYAHGKYSSKQYVGTRMMLEGKVHEVLRTLERDAGARQEAGNMMLKEAEAAGTRVNVKGVGGVQQGKEEGAKFRERERYEEQVPILA